MNRVMFFLLTIVLAFGSNACSHSTNIGSTNVETTDVESIMDNYYEENGVLHIIGMVKNTGDAPIDFVKVTALIRDEEGNLIGSEYTLTEIDTILPGKASPYHILILEGYENWQSYEIIVEAEVTDWSNKYYDFAVVSSAGKPNEHGMYHVSGEVKNLGIESVDFVKIVIVLFDQDNRIIDVGYTYSKHTPVHPDEVSSFNLTWLDVDPLKVASHEIWVEGIVTGWEGRDLTQVKTESPTSSEPKETSTPSPPATRRATSSPHNILFSTAISTPYPTLIHKATYTSHPKLTQSATSTPRPTSTPSPSPIIPSIVGRLHRIANIDMHSLGYGGYRFHPLPEESVMIIGGKSHALVMEGEVIYHEASPDLIFLGFDDSGKAWFLDDNESGNVIIWDGEYYQSLPAGGWEDTLRAAIDGYGVFSESTRQFWITTSKRYQDVRVFDGREWTIYSPQEDLKLPPLATSVNNSMKAHYLASFDQIWIASCYWSHTAGIVEGGGARWFDGDTWQGSDTTAGTGCVRAIQEDKNGNIWLGVDDVLWRFTPSTGQWIYYPVPQFEESKYGPFEITLINEIDISPYGELWVSYLLCPSDCDFSYGPEALFHLSAGEMVPILGDRWNYFGTLVFDSNSTPWYFADRELYRIVNNQFVEEMIFFTDYVVQASDGQIWVLGANFPPDESAYSVWVMD